MRPTSSRSAGPGSRCSSGRARSSRSPSCPRPPPGRSSATGCAHTRADLLQLLDVQHRRRRISPMVSFDAEPSTYRHWQLDVDGELAYLRLDVAEDGGIVRSEEHTSELQSRRDLVCRLL